MLTGIEIENFRCIEAARLELDVRCTGIIGENASGKTSLLESVYFLAHGRSFRTQHREKLLGPASDFFRVVGRSEGSRGRTVAGLEYRGGEIQAHLGGTQVGVAELAEALPVQVVDPGIHRLIEEGSARRRRLLDWGVFHVKHDFLPVWRRYQRALHQRNASLREGSASDVVGAWERDLHVAGSAVDRLRAEYVATLHPYFAAMARRLVGRDADFSYRRGWSEECELAEALSEARPRDARIRTTTLGPHRADLGFSIDGVPARDRISRGQQKMLAAAFVLSQLRCRAEAGLPAGCLMLDDPAAELDVDNLGKLLAELAEIPAQLIVTSVHSRGLEGVSPGRVFHVEQGRFTPVL